MNVVAVEPRARRQHIVSVLPSREVGNSRGQEVAERKLDNFKRGAGYLLKGIAPKEERTRNAAPGAAAKDTNSYRLTRKMLARIWQIACKKRIVRCGYLLVVFCARK